MAKTTRSLGPGRTHETRIDTRPVLELVRTVLHTNFSAPYPEDIIDQVCLAIEANPQWLKRYNSIVVDFTQLNPKNGRDVVNNSIGYWTKKETGMVAVREDVSATSKLIKSCAPLGTSTSNNTLCHLP